MIVFESLDIEAAADAVLMERRSAKNAKSRRKPVAVQFRSQYGNYIVFVVPKDATKNKGRQGIVDFLAEATSPFFQRCDE